MMTMRSGYITTRMLFATLSFTTVAPGVLAAAAQAGPASTPAQAAARVDKEVLGQVPRDSPILVSPAGQHVVWFAMQGSRSVVMVDGAAGPVFDELLDPDGGSAGRNAGAVVFSDDGAHYAYFARIGSEYIVVRDGRETARSRYDTLAIRGLAFSPGGTHLYFVTMDQDGAQSAFRLVMDSKPGPVSRHQELTPLFSPDDTHYAYIGRTNDRANPYITVVDGRQQDFIGGMLHYTGDNRLVSVISGGGTGTVLVDARPVMKGTDVLNVWTTPAGPHIAASIQIQTGARPILVVDGREVPAAEDVQDVLFSPNGKRYMAKCKPATGREFVVTDGKKGLEYQSVPLMRFSPDSSKAVYVAGSSGTSFLVIEGAESEGFPMLSGGLDEDKGLAWSQRGNHYAYATFDNSNTRHTVVVDGKRLPIEGYYAHSRVTLSPNGEHHAFLASRERRSDVAAFYRDGAQLNGFMAYEFGPWKALPAASPLFVFSPDGAHLVFKGMRDGKRDSAGLYLNDRRIYASPARIDTAAFTPDGRHLMWVAEEKDRNGPHMHPVLLIDGQRILDLNRSPFDQVEGSWIMLNDGTLRLLSLDDDGNVVRYTVRPSAHTSVQSL